ncbi:hypothetical protein Sango_3039700 [Sesamum angolense]|uniref:Reverse transcriptase domain-containing protein n=1 Tax=Sesamum angolense TaxID=2727404 RepID=A0AAE1TB00_9LAMI|nr:hypothetical protein Sango_3039700 [Sesamum angolense]
MVFKLDMAKAYDRVQWRFLYQVMRKMGFNEKRIQLITNCIEHCWFNVLINGDKKVSFSPLKVYDKEILFHHPSLSLWLNSLLEALTDYSSKILPLGTVTREVWTSTTSLMWTTL